MSLRTSTEITEIAKALATAQGEFTLAQPSGINPAFHTSYPTLGDVLQACRIAISKHGLCVVQAPGQSHPGFLTVTTRVMHISGQWIESDFTVPVGKQDAHGMMSALTYARRGGFSALLCIAPDIDDDGNQAAAAQQKGRAQQGTQQGTQQARSGQQSTRYNNARPAAATANASYAPEPEAPPVEAIPEAETSEQQASAAEERKRVAKAFKAKAALLGYTGEPGPLLAQLLGDANDPGKITTSVIAALALDDATWQQGVAAFKAPPAAPTSSELPAAENDDDDIIEGVDPFAADEEAA